jgi:hypothetical protein
MGRHRLLVSAPASAGASALAFALAATSACHGSSAPGPAAKAPVSASATSPGAGITHPQSASVSPSATADATAASSSSAAAAAPAAGVAATGGSPAGAAPFVASVPATPRYEATTFSLKNDPAFAACHASFKAAGKDVSKNLAAVAGGCAKSTHMKLVGTTITAEQSDAQPPQSYPFRAEAHRCYRVYAQSSTSIQDFDVAIKDSNGAILDQHANRAGSAVVPDDGAACFRVDDAASIVFSVGMGGGAYALQIWGD